MKFLILVLLLCGCGPFHDYPERDSVCSKDQMAKAESETTFCKNLNGYTSNYCYQTAIARNCEQRK